MSDVNPKLDLRLERLVDVRRDLVWLAWTMPEHLLKWFTPTPWRTTDCEIDLRPGGIFRTVMRGPEGQEHTNLGCYLEGVRPERLVFTNVLTPGWRPAGPSFVPSFTAVISLEAQGQRTRYTALVMHGSEEDCRKHDEMGFRDGWSKALDQLVAACQRM